MEKDETIKHEVVQTYADDMSRVIESDRSGLIKKIIHGEEVSEEEKRNISPEAKKNKIFVGVGLALIALALLALFFLIFVKKISVSPVQAQFMPLVFNDESVTIEIKGFDKKKITEAVVNEINTTQLKTGAVEGIYLTENAKPIGLREFITLLKAKLIVGEAVFVPDNFLLGVVNNEATASADPSTTSTSVRDFFILLKTRSLPDIFDSMRTWEKDMFSDLRGFFGAASSPEANYLALKGFEDGVVENKNARILYDKDGKIVMMYIFADDTSVIITDSESAAHEIMIRLASSQIKK